MATSYTPVTIDNFPEIKSLEMTDKIIFYAEADGRIEPHMVEVSAFLEHILAPGDLADLSAAVNDFEKRYRNLEREFNKTYMTPTQVGEQYSTKVHFESTISSLEKTEDFKDLLVDKADTTYLEFQSNVLKSNVQAMKRIYGSGQGFNSGNGDPKDDGKGYKLLMAGKAIEGGNEAGKGG